MTLKYSLLSRKGYYLLLLGALFGLLVSLYLWYMYLQPEPVTCIGSNSNGCEAVRQSEFSSFFGILLPAWGSFYFLFLSLILFMGYLNYKHVKEPFIALVLVFGFLFEARLAFIQVFIIKSLCFWCTSIFISLLFLNICFFYKTRFKISST